LNTTLSTKEFLSQALYLQKRINVKTLQAQTMRELSVKSNAVLSGMPKAATPNTHCMEEFIAKACDLEAEILEDMAALVNTKQEISAIINCVAKPESHTILELRYLYFQPWDNVAITLGFDKRWVYRLHNRALEEVDLIRRGS